MLPTSTYVRAVTVSSFFSACGACFAFGTGATISPIPNLPNGAYNVPTGISGDGTTVIGYANTGVRIHPFRWTASTGTVDLLGPNPSQDSYAYDVSHDGRAISGTLAGSPAWRWDAGVGVSLLSNGTSFMSFTQGISGDGQVVPGTVNGVAALWSTSGIPTSLGTLGSDPNSDALATNFDGTAATGTSGSVGSAFRWTSTGGMQSLGHLSGYTSLVPFGMSDDGDTIVGFAGNGGGDSVPFLWSESAGLVQLPRIAPTGGTIIWDVSGDGHTVVGLSDAGAYLWTQQTGAVEVGAFLASRGANLTGWFLIDASGVSADGSVITGSGIYNGVSQGYIAVIPAPGSVIVISLAGTLAMRRRRV